MALYPYRSQLVVDPDNPRNVVAGGAVSIYDSADTARTTLLALTDPSGVPIPNPFTSYANGLTPAFVTTSPEVLWVSGTYTDYFQSYKGMRDEAVGAKSAAETAASNAAAAAAADLQARIDAGELKGDKGEDGSNVVPTDIAIRDNIKNSASETRGALDSTYGGGMIAHAARVNDVRRLKGGKIGVQGKGVIAIREDHGFARFRDVHAPLQRTRSLPSGFGFVTGSINNPAATYEPTAYTWNDARRVVYKGNEAWDHSRDHQDAKPIGGSQYTITEQIEGSRALLEANELVPMGFQMPGITGAQTPGWSSHNLNTIDKLGSTEVGRRLMATYGLIEADRSGAVRLLPTDGCYLLSHVTIDTMSLAGAKAWVDRAIPGIGIEFMYHPTWLGTTGYMSIADFTAFLDYIVQKRDAGAVEVLTPSGLAFADPSTTYRMNWLKDSSFEGVTQTATTIGAWTIPTNAGITLRTDGGTDGTNYVRFEGTANWLQQAYNNIVSGNFFGGAFEIVAKVRNPHATLTGRAQMQAFISSPGGYPDFGSDNSVLWDLPPNSGWKTIRIPFVVPRLNTAPPEELTFRIRSVYGAGFEAPIDFDEVKVQPI